MKKGSQIITMAMMTSTLSGSRHIALGVHCHQKKTEMKYTLILIVVIIYSCSNKRDVDDSIVLYSEVVEDMAKDLDFSKLDSVSSQLIGKRMDNYHFTDLHGNKVELAKINKPILLEATASWCKPCKALTPAMNEIVEKYHEQMEFIYLTFDTQEKAEVYAKGLHPKINMIPSKSNKDPNSHDKLDVGEFKHFLPFCTRYYLNSEKIIEYIKIGALVPLDNSEKEQKKAKDFNMKELNVVIEKII